MAKKNPTAVLETTSAPPAGTPVTSSQDSETNIRHRESASKRKLSLSYGLTNIDTAESRPNLPMAFVDLNLLDSLFAASSCTDCGSTLHLSCGTQRGFAYNLKLLCNVCGKVFSTASTSKQLPDSRHFEVNRRMILAFLNIGQGYAGLSSFAEVMGLAGLSQATYAQHVSQIHHAAELHKQQILSDAVKRVKAAHGKDPGDTLDIAVSYDGSDGTWQKRGHTSKHGLGLVIDVTTGLTVDYHVLSKYYQKCAVVGAKKKEQGQDIYDQWYTSHKPWCTINHEGSSGMMEVESAKVLWQRSMQKGLRYTTLVSDGDCKTFDTLCSLQPYGDTPIVKEKCVNHVSKRLGTALRNLVSSETKRGITLGDRKAGSLSNTKIAILQAYYKKAVSGRAGTVEELRKRIWRTFKHAASSDDKPQHEDCPAGQKSWCFYQQAVAHGQAPPSHRGKSSSFISATVAEHVKPVYKRLTTDALLQRCLQGLTQNADESIHATIWARCPKHMFAGKPRVEIATALAVGNFNQGSHSLQQLLQTTGCFLSATTVAKGHKRDRMHVRKAERKETQEVKRRRTEIAIASARAQQEYLSAEGVSYAPGAF